jgi:hypothetical protein
MAETPDARSVDSSIHFNSKNDSLYFLFVVEGGLADGHPIFEAAELGINLERIFLPIFAKNICLPERVPTVTRMQA